MNRTLLALLLCGSVFLSVPLSVCAQSETYTQNDAQNQHKEAEAAPVATPAEDATAEVNYAKLESLGILETIDSGSLGLGLYHATSRKNISEFIPVIQNHHGLLALHRLGNRLLLTRANAGQINNDISPKPDSDLLTLRLESLLKRGMLSQATELIARIDEGDLYSERLSRMAMITVLFSGEKGLACLENNAMDQSLKTTNFWKVLDAYCSINLSSGANETAHKTIKESEYKLLPRILSDENYKFIYAPESYDSLSLLERAILSAEKRIIAGDINSTRINNLPPHHIQALLKGAQLSQQDQIILTAQAVRTGVLPAYMLGEQLLLTTQAIKEAKREPAGIEELSMLIKRVKGDWFYEDPQAALQKSMEYAQTQQNPAFIAPFVNLYEGLQGLDGYNLEQIELILRAFIIAERTIPGVWMTSINNKNVSENETSMQKEKLLMAAAILSDSRALEAYKAQNEAPAPQADANNPRAAYRNIIENIDNTTGQYAKVRNVYENGFDLASNKSYRMPPEATLDLLAKAAEKGAVAEVVALSHISSAHSKGEPVFPALVKEIYEKLAAVGLMKQAKEVIAQAVLDTE